jgi:hypothetical protein
MRAVPSFEPVTIRSPFGSNAAAKLSRLPLRQRLGSVGLRCGYLFELLALGVLPSRLGFLARPNELVV